MMERMVMPANFLLFCQDIWLYRVLIHSLIAVILYHSVFHQNCRPERGYIRACLKSNVCLVFGNGIA